MEIISNNEVQTVEVIRDKTTLEVINKTTNTVEIDKGSKGEPGIDGIANFNATNLPTTIDLDSLQTPGIYRQNISTDASLANHYPVAGGLWIIEVLSRGSGSYYQRAYKMSNTGAGQVVYVRRASSGVWDSWRVLSSQKIVNPTTGPGIELSTWDDVNNVDRRIMPTNISLGNVHLDTIVTPGFYYQGTAGSASVANGYPLAGGTWALEVIPAGNSDLYIIQRLTSRSATGQGRGLYERRRAFGATSEWTTWGFITSQRVDNTAGRAIYTWDDVNGRDQLIYGDTGWRAISSLLVNGWTVNTNLWIRRTDYQVSIVFDGLVSSSRSADAVFAPPAGFVPQTSVGSRGVLHTATTPAVMYRMAYTSGNHALVSSTTSIPVLYGRIDYATLDAWPTTLPGTAQGTIPNV